jgi:hypothetical protein
MVTYLRWILSRAHLGSVDGTFLAGSVTYCIRSPFFARCVRICPCHHVAKDELYLFVAQALATLTISKAFDSIGYEVEPVISYSSTLIRFGVSPQSLKCGISVLMRRFGSQPKQFGCRISPRYQGVNSLVAGLN